jgi:5-(carboxyamino)imidazole ribonucleotide mutase
MDSLLSIVQMPAGVPVATVSIGGARNAGLLAVRILAAGETEYAAGLRTALVEFAGGLRDAATEKGEKLRARTKDAGGSASGVGPAQPVRPSTGFTAR